MERMAFMTDNKIKSCFVRFGKILNFINIDIRIYKDIDKNGIIINKNRSINPTI
jgi:hypothetical protein